ncbi:hypothetical protein BU23DRAFT_325620 [Bimuria novae-zelandiae CBS 107.79]|uniref:Uncharacterized protein n=1 Tax=Bimuria novae-zelandiae CBS 107.79 TaxID=1447943 RepID=A0A6A5UR29_9PLEO|nr:hypothetical protein BU23DRAFT_325620 [Bimuria novae-zelandiae CBS 107.79]
MPLRRLHGGTAPVALAAPRPRPWAARLATLRRGGGKHSRFRERKREMETSAMVCFFAASMCSAVQCSEERRGRPGKRSFIGCGQCALVAKSPLSGEREGQPHGRGAGRALESRHDAGRRGQCLVLRSEPGGGSERGEGDGWALGTTKTGDGRSGGWLARQHLSPTLVAPAECSLFAPAAVGCQ